jgi:hypothetical protein
MSEKIILKSLTCISWNLKYSEIKEATSLRSIVGGLSITLSCMNISM